MTRLERMVETMKTSLKMSIVTTTAGRVTIAAQRVTIVPQRVTIAAQRVTMAL